MGKQLSLLRLESNSEKGVQFSVSCTL